jgi:hypothetical protein
MNKIETFYYYFGIVAFYLGFIILIYNTWDWRKRVQNNLRHFLIRKRSKGFGAWCVVLKWKNDNALCTPST